MESLSNDYLKKTTDVLKQKLIRRECHSRDFRSIRSVAKMALFAHKHFPYANAHTRYRTCLVVFTPGLPGGGIRRNENNPCLTIISRRDRTSSSIFFEDILSFRGCSIHTFRRKDVTLFYTNIFRIRTHTRDITLFIFTPGFPGGGIRRNERNLYRTITSRRERMSSSKN